MTVQNVLLDWSVPVAEIPETGKRVSRSATPQERRAVAEALDILDVTALECDVRLRPLRQGRYQMTGVVKAAIEQACVVSLEPVAGAIEETVDLEFWPPDQIPGAVSTPQDEWLDPDAPDGAEPIENGKIALGRLVYEIVATGQDPYPRKAGAQLAYKEKPEASAKVHPFAALAKLKQQKP